MRGVRAGRAAPAPASIGALRGVGPARVAALARVGVRTLRDLALFAPLRLENRAAKASIAAVLASGVTSESVCIGGLVQRTTLSRFGRRSTFRALVDDGSGAIVCVFFNQPWLQKSFVVGARIEVEGRFAGGVKPAITATRASLDASDRARGDDEHGAERALPDPIASGPALRPVYVLASGLSHELVGKLARAALEHVQLVEDLPRDELARASLPDLAAAARELHAPTSPDAFRAARRRIALERLLHLRARLEARRAHRLEATAAALRVSDGEDRRIRAAFGFGWTGAQMRCGDEVRADLAAARPMRRLLQGDVGAGKTALGLYACALAARSGAQAAFVAPTELLAEQHHGGARAWLERLGLSSVLVTGGLSARERNAAARALARGEVDVAFGTHALFSKNVRFARLGAAVIDEQHRFGVTQRSRLLEKGEHVHALLMSATPIPRTLALALYGDLDVSVLDEAPAGRGRITTRLVRGGETRGFERALVEELESGGQVFWIVPRIDGEEPNADGAPREALGAEGAAEGPRAHEMGAERRFQRLLRSPLAAHGVELVHGRLDRAERQRALERFRSGAARTLVATTIVEVGVDVPAASAMVVEGAERLGLAQLHQLRGRIGRGARDSTCWLIAAQSARERCAVLERTRDGFEIAEADLERRGMGDLGGLRQSGVNQEGLDEALLDAELLALCERVLRGDPRLVARYIELAATDDPFTP